MLDSASHSMSCTLRETLALAQPMPHPVSLFLACLESAPIFAVSTVITALPGWAYGEMPWQYGVGTATVWVATSALLGTHLAHLWFTICGLYG